MWALLGIAVIIIGFMRGYNPLLVVVFSALITGLGAGIHPVAIIEAFGKAFNDARYVSVVWLVLPVVGLMERFGLQERARALITGMQGATSGRLLAGYMLLRQLTAALGLTSIAGHAQTVRPLVAPMALAAAERSEPGMSAAERDRVKAMSAATDNIGLFFGEDIFIAIGSILLMKGVLEGYGYIIEPLHFSLWAIPTAIAAFLIHSLRIVLFARRLRRERPDA